MVVSQFRKCKYSFQEMQPYLKGGVTQVLDLSTETGTSSLYEENSRYLNTPSLVRFHPEPRELKFTPTTGILPTLRRRKFRTVTVKLPQARRNQTLAVDALSLCCELFTSPCPVFLSNPKGSLSKSTATATATAAEVHDSPASPQPDECSPSSPPPDATGMPQESPASPDHPEMRTVKILDEKLPDRFRVEYKEGMMKMFLDPEPAKTVSVSQSFVWVIYLSIDWLIDSDFDLIDFDCDRLIDWLILTSIYQLIDLSIDWLIDWLTSYSTWVCCSWIYSVVERLLHVFLLFVSRVMEDRHTGL